VVLQITDKPFINAAAIVTQRRLESIGFKVILKAMDSSASLVARTRKEPPDKGGWNLLFTWWQAADVSNPAVHFGVSGAGPRAWFGWPMCPRSKSSSPSGCARRMNRNVDGLPTRSKGSH
jgi:peptide/nickel transport system substrate-binding protein